MSCLYIPDLEFLGINRPDLNAALCFPRQPLVLSRHIGPANAVPFAWWCPQNHAAPPPHLALVIAIGLLGGTMML